MKHISFAQKTITLIIPFFMVSCYDFEVPHAKISAESARNEEVIILKKDTSLTEICETQKVTWAPGGNESILLDPQPGAIYPGSVLDASSFQNGKFTPITGERKPIKISISGPIFEMSSAIVEKPSPANVDSMINVILKSKKISIEPSQTAISCYEIYSKEQLSLIFRAKYSGGVTNVEAGFNFNDQSIQSRYLLDVTQVYYSINVDPIRPKDFFPANQTASVIFHPSMYPPSNTDAGS